MEEKNVFEKVKRKIEQALNLNDEPTHYRETIDGRNETRALDPETKEMAKSVNYKTIENIKKDLPESVFDPNTLPIDDGIENLVNHANGVNINDDSHPTKILFDSTNSDNDLNLEGKKMNQELDDDPVHPIIKNADKRFSHKLPIIPEEHTLDPVNSPNRGDNSFIKKPEPIERDRSHVANMQDSDKEERFEDELPNYDEVQYL